MSSVQSRNGQDVHDSQHDGNECSQFPEYLPVPYAGKDVTFLLYEVITRRKPGEKFLEYAQVIGMIFLIALFILVNVNDVVRFFG